ncbi:type II secretion system protein [Candidatus Parcubacteria bacterium]|nr:MAG: type II secretion system protein [Candidatus Parcubacteria bacterium]
MSKFKTATQNSKLNKGMLLLEIIIVIAVLAVVITIGSQTIFVSLRSNKTAGERDSALKLAEETFEAVRTVAAENWLNLYKPPDGSGDPVTSKGSSNHYYPSQSDGKWILQSGDEIVSVGGITYTRYFSIDNASRDSNKDIESTYNSSNDDPSTQKISVTVSSSDIADVTATEYVFRWRNKVCHKTDWSGGKTYPTDGVETCSSGVSTYYNDDGNIDASQGGSIKLSQ